MDELKIADDDTFYDLEQLITEGVDARVPIEIKFPNGKKAGALIKPITTNELKTIMNSTNDEIEVMIECLELGLLNKNGEPLPRNLIEELPMGLPANIFTQICTISGLDIPTPQLPTTKELMGKMESFP